MSTLRQLLTVALLVFTLAACDSTGYSSPDVIACSGAPQAGCPCDVDAGSQSCCVSSAMGLLCDAHTIHRGTWQPFHDCNCLLPEGCPGDPYHACGSPPR